RDSDDPHGRPVRRKSQRSHRLSTARCSRHTDGPRRSSASTPDRRSRAPPRGRGPPSTPWTLDIGEQCGHGFAFAVESFGGGRVGYSNQRIIRFFRGCNQSLRKRSSTFTAEVLPGFIRSTALRTQACKGSGALRAKLASLTVVSSALCATHR